MCERDEKLDRLMLEAREFMERYGGRELVQLLVPILYQFHLRDPYPEGSAFRSLMDAYDPERGLIDWTRVDDSLWEEMEEWQSGPDQWETPE